MNSTACAFTGHRPRSFLWKYNEADQDCLLLKRVLAAQIQALAEQGVTDFLSGMALGVDLWSARIVLDQQKRNTSKRHRSNRELRPEAGTGDICDRPAQALRNP